MKVMDSLASIKWHDFYLKDFFSFEKGNQNNMASLKPGDIPLVSARKLDNGYKDFVSSNGKKLFDGGIITLNNDGDGGAGLAYFQPYKMALDSHVTALVPKVNLTRHQLLFISMCISKQRNRFGHGYSINANRLKAFKLMLPATDDLKPNWDFMGTYMKNKEIDILQPTLNKLCKSLIINTLTGG